MRKISAKKGDILIGDVIFLVLNLIFITILILFVVNKTDDPAKYEEKYAKQIALMIDSAKPGMVLVFNMKDAVEIAVKNGVRLDKIVAINGNIITVDLRGKGGYSYSFFNDVDVGSYPDINFVENYVFTINEK